MPNWFGARVFGILLDIIYPWKTRTSICYWCHSPACAQSPLPVIEIYRWQGICFCSSKVVEPVTCLSPLLQLFACVQKRAENLFVFSNLMHFACLLVSYLFLLYILSCFERCDHLKWRYIKAYCMYVCMYVCMWYAWRARFPAV